MTASAGPALHELFERFGGRVEFVALYVREAHPGDRYVQPRDMQTKSAHAREYQQRDRIPWTIAMDEIDGRVHRMLDGKPHMAYVVGTDGRVTYRALWTNHASGIKAALESVTIDGDRTFAQDDSKLQPMLSGVGVMWETLKRSGPTALADVGRAAPPMWLSARIASFFRPLPPALRGAVGMAATMALPVALLLAARKLRNR